MVKIFWYFFHLLTLSQMIQFERYVLYVNSFWSSVMWWRSYFVYWTLRNQLQWIQAFFPPSYAFESICQLLAILFRPQCIDTTRFLLTSVYLYKLISVCLNTMYQFIKSMTQVTCFSYFFSFSQIKVTLHKTWIEYICFRRLLIFVNQIQVWLRG